MSTLDGTTSMYGLAGSPSNHKWRARLSEFLDSTDDLNLVELADSMGGGWDGSAYHFDTNLFRSFGRELARLTGKHFGGGIQFLGGDSAGHVADNVHISGSAFSQSIWIALTGATGVCSVDLADPGTVVAFVYLDSGTGTMPWKIDGVSQTGIVLANSGTLKLASVGGLSSGLHTVEFDGVASKSFAVTAVWCYDPTVQSIYAHSGSVGGSRANGGAQQLNWSNTAVNALGGAVVNSLKAFGITDPDLLVTIAGANDISNLTPPATAATGIQNMRNYFASSPALLVAEPMAFGSNLANTQALIDAIYALGDSLVVPVFDLDNYWGAGSKGDGNATAITDGLLSPVDKTHPLQFEQEAVGQHMARALFNAA